VEQKSKILLVPENHFDWISIILWSFGIAFGVFFLMWLRIEHLDPYLNDTIDSVFFFIPHVLVIFWGITTGLSIRSNQKPNITIIKRPFLTVLLTAITFDAIFSLWGARVDPIENYSYIENFFKLFTSLSLIATILWILTPFIIGCVLAIIVRYIYDRTNKSSFV
jgi:hypothetical protein